jgi:hypothetical protein
VINSAIGGTGFTTTSTFQTISPVDLTGVSGLQGIAAGTTVRFRIVPYGGSAARRRASPKFPFFAPGR